MFEVDPPCPTNAAEYLAIPLVVTIFPPLETVIESLITIWRPILATTESESVTLTVMLYVPTGAVAAIDNRPVVESSVIPVMAVA